MRGLLRRRQRGGTRENEASRAGLRPEGVYVYAERSQGRANRPFLAGEHRCGEASRTMSSKPAQNKQRQCRLWLEVEAAVAEAVIGGIGKLPLELVTGAEELW